MSRFKLALFSCLFGAHAVIAQTPVPPIIDVHAHFESGPRGTNFRAALEGAIRRMDQNGFSQALLMPQPFPAGQAASYDIDAFASIIRESGGRFHPVGGGGSLNGMIHATSPGAVSEQLKKAFRARAEEIAAAGAVAFGEIALHHMSMRMRGPQHPYEIVAPDHPLLLLLADIAAEKNMPVDLHLDLVPQDMPLPERPVFNPGRNPSTLPANIEAFERLLAHNRNARFVWAHAGTDSLGTRTPPLQAGLLSRNPNLYMSLRLGTSGPPPFVALGQDGRLKPFWLQLLSTYPDRFVIGTDVFHNPGNANLEESLENYRMMLGQLPADLAEAIANGNARRLYRLR